MDSGSARTGYSWARASLVMMIAIFASRLLGVLRDTVIAYRFGQNEFTDAYRAAFQLPDLLFFMVAGGAISSSLMPVFAKYWDKGNQEEAWRVFSSVATVMVSLVTVLVILLELITPWAVVVMFPGFDPQRREMTTVLSRIVLPTQICFLMGGLMMTTLFARKRFLVPAISPNIYNLGIIFGGLALALWLGIAGLAWGALLGAFLGSVVIPMVAMARLGVQFRPRIELRHEGVREVFRMMLPVMFGLTLPGIYMLLLRVFASWLPPGAISALDNANRQMQAPLGIIGQGVAMAVFPALNTLAVHERWSELRAVLKQSLRLVWFLTAPATVLLLVLAEDISRVLLQYGKFTPSDTEMVASALRAFALGLFAWSGQALIARAFFAMRNALTPVLIGSATTLVFVPLCFLFLWGLQWGHVGLALATSISASLQMVWMLIAIRSRLPNSSAEASPTDKEHHQQEVPFIRPVLTSGLSAVVVGISAYWLHSVLNAWVSTQGWQPNLTALGMVLLFSMGVMTAYLALCRWLGVPEVNYVKRVLGRETSQSTR